MLAACLAGWLAGWLGAWEGILAGGGGGGLVCVRAHGRACVRPPPSTHTHPSPTHPCAPTHRSDPRLRSAAANNAVASRLGGVVASFTSASL